MENGPAAAVIFGKQRVFDSGEEGEGLGEDRGGVLWLKGVNAQKSHPYPSLSERRAELWMGKRGGLRFQQT